MSVINNVLKDLENRSSQFTPIDIASVENLSTQNPKQTVSHVITLLLVLLLAGLSYGLYLFQHEMAIASKPTELASTTLAPIGPPAQPVVEPTAPVNQIIDLQIRESVDDMTLDFSLREKVISYLKERTENSFVYHLKNIQSEIVAPAISNNRWIEQFALSANDEGVDVRFRTASGVLVETRQNSTEGQRIWSLKLKKLAGPPQVSAQAEALVIKPVDLPVTRAGIDEPVESDPGPTVETPEETAPETKVVKLDIKSTQQELSPGDRLQKARLYIKTRRWSEAETLLLALIEGPQDLPARTLLLSIFQQGQQLEKFTALIDESVNLYPQQALFKTEYARMIFQQKDFAKVIELLGDRQDANAPQLALLAASHQRLDRHSQAIEYYRQSLNKDARQAKNWIGLGISLEQTAQFEAALRAYAAAKKLGRLNTRLHAFIDKRMKQLSAVAN